jgi:hypothetical protein
MFLMFFWHKPPHRGNRGQRAGGGAVALTWLPAPSDRGVLRAGFLRRFDIGQGCFGPTSPMCDGMLRRAAAAFKRAHENGHVGHRPELVDLA